MSGEEWPNPPCECNHDPANPEQAEHCLHHGNPRLIYRFLVERDRRITELETSRAEAWQSRIRYHAFLRQIQEVLGSEGSGDELVDAVMRLVDHLPMVDLKRAGSVTLGEQS